VRPVAATACIVVLLGGCDLSMTVQRKYKTYSPSKLWADGASARPLPDDGVAQGDLTLAAVASAPPDASPALLARGRERFDIYCAPCHGLAGDGDGVIVAHGFPGPPSYHVDRLLAAPAHHFYNAISQGYGVMYSYSDRVNPHDRWAIVAYIRALQFSRRANIAEVPDAKDVLR
jgi:mono/diheme cytochrome c family protein